MYSAWIKTLFASSILLGVSSLSLAGDITVSAAASLTNAFQEVARSYESQYQDSKVLLNFGASGALLQQIAKGAPVDVFASADQETMDQAEQQQLLASGTRQDFVGNALVLVVPADSALQLKQLGDLQQAAVSKIAIGNPASVPVGRYSQTALKAAGLWDSLQPKVIGTQNVRQSLDYVARGEVDAAFVYTTDARVMPDTVKIAFPVPLSSAIRYPIAQLADSANAEEARRFIAYVMSTEGQAILARHGFLKP